jgi:mycothiol synthase
MTSVEPTIPVDIADALSAAELAAVLELVAAVTDEDGVKPFSDQALLHLRAGPASSLRHLLARRNGRLAGYALVDTSDPAATGVELAVAPDERRLGVGTALVRKLLAIAPAAPIRLWAHGDPPAGARLAARFDFRRTRSLWQMRRSLREPLPDLAVPEGIRIRPFVVGGDEQAWTALNNRAFANHPEQGRWTVRDVELREQEPWFDPAGFLLAERTEPSAATGGELLGFHWTKVHDRDVDGPPETRGRPIGEVYVVGVAPEAAGRGLGRVLTLAGLHHLQGRGLPAVLLYVDEDNSVAIRTYERLGFTRYSTDVQYSHPGGSAAT